MYFTAEDFISAFLTFEELAMHFTHTILQNSR